MKLRIPVSTIMVTNVVKLNVTDSLTKAESLFKDYKIRHLPVVSGDHVIGILSYTDLLRISLTEEVDGEEEVMNTTVYNMYSLEQVMVKNVTTIQANANIKDAAEILAESDFRALPVLDGEKLVGILTTTDLIKYMLKQYN